MLSVVRGRWTNGDDMPEINLRYAIIPLYLVGKLFCLNAFTYSPGWVDHSASKDDTRLRGDYDDVDGNRSAPPRRSFEWTKNRTESRANNAFGNANHYDNICEDNHYRNGIITASGDTAPTTTTTNNRNNKKNSVVLWTTALRNHMHVLKPGSQRSLKFSIAGIVHVVASCTAYGSYHVYSTLELFSKTKRPELVRMVIDLINQYAGCCLVVTLVSAALVNQHSLMKLINTLFEIDDLLMSRLNIAARSGRWLLHITTLFIASIVIKSVIGTAFYSTSDEDPSTSSNLLMFRLIPRVMCLVSELQYIAYVLLIKDRYVALKQTLSRGTETPSKANNGTVKWKENSQTANRLAENHHPKGFAVHHDGTSVAAAGNDCLPTNVTNPSMTSKLDGCQHRLNLQAARTNQLRHIYEIYLRLRQTIRLTNRSFGVRNLILILYQFVTVVQMGYMVCMLWVRKIDDPADKQNKANLLVTVIFAGCFLAEILAICAYSHSTMNEDYGTRQLIFAHLHNEIDDTGSGLSANPSIRFNLLDQRFDCLGLFDVNLSLFYGIVGAMTTYLIILIQFGHLGSLR